MNANFESHSISRRSFLKASGVVGAASILAACGGSSSSTAASTSGAASGAAAPAADAITDYVSFETANRELETWNFLYSQSASDLNVTTNCWDGLLSFDCYGKAVPAIASSWEHNEDSTVWTFHLRDDVDWVDCNGEVKEHITATDFLVGLEWVLNASKNEANNTSMPTLYIVGAEEYYEKTKDMGAAAADLRYQDMLDAGVGIEAPDDYTLVFTCKHSCPYFDTVVSYTSFYPASQVLIDELGIETFRGCDTYWAIPAGSSTACTGKWEIGPRMDLFHALEAALGKLPIIAEDLGELFPSVRELLADSTFPGMKVLQFAFGGGDNEYLPHNHVKNSVVYPGTHDNTTLTDWWENAATGKEKANAAAYLHLTPCKPTAKEVAAVKPDAARIALLRAALGSVADRAIIPMSDWLGLGAEAHLNTPGKLGGNWTWRAAEGFDAEPLASRIQAECEVYCRAEEPVEKEAKTSI